MNPEHQPAAEFDPAEELTHFHDDEHQLYGLSERTFFYLVQTTRAIESFATPVFTVEAVLDPKTKAPAGGHVEFVVHQHAFRIDTWQHVKLWAGEADEADSSSSRRWLVFEGDAANPTAWQGLLQEIGRVEHFYVCRSATPTRFDRRGREWLVEQKRRRDERGF